MNISLYLQGLLVMVALAVATWVVSLVKRDVSIVDSIWSLMIVAGGLLFLLNGEPQNTRSAIIFSLLALWALRLSIYLTWRNWGEPEDRRYRKIRENSFPNFAFKSLGIIFLLQAVLAWVITLPLLPALDADVAMQSLDYVAAALWLIGMLFEVVGDAQLACFKSDPQNRDKVMNKGLWRYTRHPNYFGEALIWWGFYLFALTVGAWWTFPAPLLMTWLLLKFSGVVMLEKGIQERRPAYRAYMESTNAFIPGPPKQKATPVAGGEA